MQNVGFRNGTVSASYNGMPLFQTWVSLAEYCLKDQNWTKIKRKCFNDRRNPEDDELDTQIVKVRSALFQFVNSYFRAICKLT